MLDYAELVHDVLNGNESPLKAYAILTLLKKDLEKSISEIKDYALDEANKHPEKTFEDGDFKFEKRAGGAIYNFKEIEEWQTYSKALKDCEARYKSAYSNHKQGLIAVTTDGEQVELPLVTYKSDMLIVK